MLKVIELFSGIGSQTQALKNIDIQHEVIATSEIDKYAIISYDAIHSNQDENIDTPTKEEMLQELISKNVGYNFQKQKFELPKSEDEIKKLYIADKRSRNLGDVSLIEKLPCADLITYSFPCTDISVAGKQEGLSKGSGTRSGLLWEVERLLLQAKENNTLPKYLLLENVKNLVGKKFINDFNEWLNVLDTLGYNTYWQVLNAKNYGTPQNRERVFGVSILKDIDKGYKFPKGFDNGLRLKNILEDKVDEQYYISEEKTKKLLEKLKNKDKIHNNSNNLSVVGNVGNTGHCGLNVYSENGISPTLKARDFKDPIRIMQVGSLEGKHEMTNRVYSSEGVSPTINAGNRQNCTGGYNSPKILEENELKFIGGIESNKRIEDGKELSRNYKEGYRVYESNGVAACQKSNGGGIGSYTGLYLEENKEASKPELIGGIGEINFGKQYPQGNRVYSSDKTAMALLAQPVGNTGGYSYLYVVEEMEKPQVCEQRYDEGLRFFKDNICGSLRTIDSGGDKRIIEIDCRIRKLTPLECWRLMGFSDEAFYKAKYYSKQESEEILKKHPKHKGKRIFSHEERIERMSNTQLYKQAGNSIVVKVLEKVFESLIEIYPKHMNNIKVLSLFSGIGAFEEALKNLSENKLKL